MGDKFEIKINGETTKGVIIDYESYPEGRILIVQLPNEGEVEVNEEKSDL